MNRNPHRAIIVIGREDPDEVTFQQVERYDEVFVIARAVADPTDRWLTDDDRNHARARLTRALARLRTRGVRALGAVGDENEAAALGDVRSLFPGAQAIFA